MNLGIAGVGRWESACPLSFTRGILEISLMFQSLCQYIVRIAGLGIDPDSSSLFFNTVLGPAQGNQQSSIRDSNLRTLRRCLRRKVLCLLVELQRFALISQSFVGHREIERGQRAVGREFLGCLKR